MLKLVRVTLGCAFVLAPLLGGCAEDGAAVTAPPATGCGRTSTALDGANCRVQWNCTEGGQHVLICAELDDGSVACQCAVGDETPELMPVPDGCGAEPFEDRVAEICGWSLQ
jgi:hypothetical protein